MADLARHTLVHLTPDAWTGIVAAEPALCDWAAADHPAIVRRPARDDPPGTVPLGVPLPPAAGKRRMALRCLPPAIVRAEPPALLRDVAATAPAAWQVTIAVLLRIDREARCYGSLAWQHLTGLRYLTDDSDLDLLFACVDAASADRAAADIAIVAKNAPMRIDGELVFRDGAAVQWREWFSGAADVAVKTIAGTLLRPRAHVAP